MAAKKNVLIIGGGLTGLSAALRLARDGRLAITVVESSCELGGLAGGFQIGGTWLEKTYHHLFLTDTSILKLVEDLGLKDRLLWCDSSVGIFRNGKIHSFKTPLDLLRFKPCSFLGRLRTGFTALYLKHRKNWHGFARQTAHTWMTRACGPSAMENIWTPLLKGKFEHHYERVSMAWFWARIHIRANSRSGGDGEKLGYFRGGFQILISALERELRSRGVTIQLNTRVEQILNDRTAVINGIKVPFDMCIFTGASGRLAGILPKTEHFRGYVTKLHSIDYLGALCMVFTSDQDLGDYYWVNINEPNAPFLVFLNHTKLVDKSFYAGKYVYYIGAYVPPDSKLFLASDGDLTMLWFGYLPKMFPEFDPARVSERHVFRFQNAQHIVDTDYESKIPDFRTPVPGLYLANFSQIFPEDRGTNFAVRDGFRIAEMVLNDVRLQ